MKKKYVTPVCKIAQIKEQMDIIQTSYVNIGGSTNTFNTRQSFFDDEEDDE